MNSVSGYTLYDDGEIVQMLAIYTNTLVFPGYTLPLIISAVEIPIMERFIKKNNMFVLICAKYKDDFFSFVVRICYRTLIAVQRLWKYSRTVFHWKYLKHKCETMC